LDLLPFLLIFRVQGLPRARPTRPAAVPAAHNRRRCRGASAWRPGAARARPGADHWLPKSPRGLTRPTPAHP